MMKSDRAPSTVTQNNITQTLSSMSQAEFFMVFIRENGSINHNAVVTHRFRSQWNT